MEEQITVLAYVPQKFRGQINANTNYPPQRADESGATPGGTMDFEDLINMEYEDGIDMDYES